MSASLPIASGQTFAANEIICEENSLGEHAYFIEQGLVEVYKFHGENRVSIAKLGPGDFFGEMALIEAKPRNASVIALEKTTCAVISQKVLFEVLQESHPLVQALIHNLVRHLRITTEANATAHKNSKQCCEPKSLLTAEELEALLDKS